MVRQRKNHKSHKAYLVFKATAASADTTDNLRWYLGKYIKNEPLTTENLSYKNSCAIFGNQDFLRHIKS